MPWKLCKDERQKKLILVDSRHVMVTAWVSRDRGIWCPFLIPVSGSKKAWGSAHSINKYLLSTYYVSYIVIGAKDSALTKTQSLLYETYIRIKATENK